MLAMLTSIAVLRALQCIPPHGFLTAHFNGSADLSLFTDISVDAMGLRSVHEVPVNRRMGAWPAAHSVDDGLQITLQRQPR